MPTLRIHDLDNGVLAVHLPQLLDLLAPISLDAEWIVAPVRSDGTDKFEATGSGAEELEELADASMPVSGMELMILSVNTEQIVWGEFVATMPGAIEPWMSIRVIDSTFFEIETADVAALAAIRSAYQDVRDA